MNLHTFLQGAISDAASNYLVIQNAHGLIIASVFKNKLGDIILCKDQQYSLLGEKGEIVPLNPEDQDTIANAKFLLKHL